MVTKLFDEIRDLMRRRHYSIHTGRAYRGWVKCYARFHNTQSRDDLRHGEGKIEAFLTHLARDRQVAVSTQNQAINTLIFLYKHVLKQPLSGEINADRARRKAKIPVVLTREETARVSALRSAVHDKRISKLTVAPALEAHRPLLVVHASYPAHVGPRSLVVRHAFSSVHSVVTSPITPLS